MNRLVAKLRKASEEMYIHRRTRHTLRASADHLKAIQDAWVDAGPVPEYHEHMQNKLRRDWPTLANALDEATK